MVDTVGNDVHRLGLWSALLVAVWVALFGSFMLLGLFGVHAERWAFLVCLLLAPSFVVMMTSIHYQTAPERRVWSQLGLAFGRPAAALCLRPWDCVLLAGHARLCLYVPVHLVRRSCLCRARRALRVDTAALHPSRVVRFPHPHRAGLHVGYPGFCNRGGE